MTEEKKNDKGHFSPKKHSPKGYLSCSSIVLQIYIKEHEYTVNDFFIYLTQDFLKDVLFLILQANAQRNT